MQKEDWEKAVSHPPLSSLTVSVNQIETYVHASICTNATVNSRWYSVAKKHLHEKFYIGQNVSLKIATNLDISSTLDLMDREL